MDKYIESIIVLGIGLTTTTIGYIKLNEALKEDGKDSVDISNFISFIFDAIEKRNKLGGI